MRSLVPWQSLWYSVLSLSVPVTQSSTLPRLSSSSWKETTDHPGRQELTWTKVMRCCFSRPMVRWKARQPVMKLFVFSLLSSTRSILKQS